MLQFGHIEDKKKKNLCVLNKLANLFKKFSRGEGTFLIHTEGTGLGLYVARLMYRSASRPRLQPSPKAKARALNFALKCRGRKTKTNCCLLKAEINGNILMAI